MPCLSIGELDPLAYEEAELEENIRRTDLTWQEQAAATARLADLRRRQAASLGTSLPTTADVAREVRNIPEGEELGSAHTEVRRDLILAQHLGNPAVAAAKSREEAWKALKREDNLQRNADLAAVVGRTFTADLHVAHHADAVEWMKQADSSQFDVILTDPPYGMGADEFKDGGGQAGGAQTHRYEDSEEIFERCFDALLQNGFRLAKPQAHLYLFCDIDRFHECREQLALEGWKCFRTPLIWHKPGGIRAPWPQHGPHRKWEMILYAVKGDRPVTKLFPDLVSYSSDSNLGHSAQKPVALYEDLLKRSVRPGDKVLDPFMGTGPIFLAAHALKCTAVGIEQDAASYGIALRRIQSLKEEEE